jgi:hypothetical protein
MRLRAGRNPSLRHEHLLEIKEKEVFEGAEGLGFSQKKINEI